MNTLIGRIRILVALLAGGLSVASCGGDREVATGGGDELGVAPVGNYCALPPVASPVLVTRPAPGEDPIDDVNWFARPVPHAGPEWLIAFASHDQNYLYDLTNGRRIRIPDRSDAVATPDGKYMTVPSFYTADANTRFYPIAPMLDALERGQDIPDLEPAFIDQHPSMSRVYYQSTAYLGADTTASGVNETYRLMFSGTGDESKFRIRDYEFRYDNAGELTWVEPAPPMTICGEITNDLNTPFISKDGRHVAAYTSGSPGIDHSPGASLKLFEITDTDPGAGTTQCRHVADFGFAAGKADFSFDGTQLAFHSSQGAYLTVFVNGGLPGTTITDVLVTRLDRDPNGDVTGYSGLQRLTVSLEAGVGSYFPSFLPDGKLFYIQNRVARDSEREKRFHFQVVDPNATPWQSATLDSPETAARWAELGELWEAACVPPQEPVDSLPFPLAEHELPFQALGLSAGQCTALVADSRAAAEVAGAPSGASIGSPNPDLDQLADFCSRLVR